MNLNSINAFTSSVAAASGAKTEQTSKAQSEKEKQVVIGKSDFSVEAATYTPSKEGLEKQDAHMVDKPATDRSAIVQQLQADAEAQKNSLIDMVREALGKQSSTYSLSIGDEDDIWKFLAKGDFTVTEAAKKEAQEAISEDGYWGVEQTAQRIFDFAQTLSGGNVEKADTLLNAFKEGFSQATKIWGSELPDISQRTYEAVEKKFEEWKKSMNSTETDPTMEAVQA